MKPIVSDVKLIAACGLYCGACRWYLKEKCSGCRENAKAAKWCKPRTCCLEREYRSCAECRQFEDVMKCGSYNNFISKLFGLIFRSNRKACVDLIKANGYDNFAAHMAEHRLQSLKR